MSVSVVQLTGSGKLLLQTSQRPLVDTPVPPSLPPEDELDEPDELEELELPLEEELE